jgi:hypothetical protein
MFKRTLMPCFCALLIACSLMSLPVFAQGDRSSSQAQNENTIEGTVISSSRSTVLVRSDDNQFHLFTFSHDSTRPRTLPVGAHVRVASVEGDQANARLATNITVLDQASRGTTSSSATAQNTAPVPPAVQRTENEIKRQARRWHVGVRAGVALDPELVMFGVHSQMGPIFSSRIVFRPNADFSWGEVTDMIALNLEAVYLMPRSSRHEWTTYVGGGPALNFIEQTFSTSGGEHPVSFSDFNYQTGLNVLMGIEHRNGTFFEVKTGLYSSPAPILRLIIGKNF